MPFWSSLSRINGRENEDEEITLHRITDATYCIAYAIEKAEKHGIYVILYLHDAVGHKVCQIIQELTNTELLNRFGGTNVAFEMHFYPGIFG